MKSVNCNASPKKMFKGNLHNHHTDIFHKHYEFLSTSVRAVLDQCTQEFQSELTPEQFDQLANIGADDRYTGLNMLLNGTQAEDILSMWLKESNTPANGLPQHGGGKENASSGASGVSKVIIFHSPSKRAGLNTNTDANSNRGGLKARNLNTATAAAGAQTQDGTVSARAAPNRTLHPNSPFYSTSGSTTALKIASKARQSTPGSMRNESLGTMISISPFTSEERQESLGANVTATAAEEVPATVINRSGCAVATSQEVEDEEYAKSRSGTQAHVLHSAAVEVTKESEEAVIPEEEEPIKDTTAAAAASLSPSISMARAVSPSVHPPPGARVVYKSMYTNPAALGTAKVNNQTAPAKSLTSSVFGYLKSHFTPATPVPKLDLASKTPAAASPQTPTQLHPHSPRSAVVSPREACRGSAPASPRPRTATTNPSATTRRTAPPTVGRAAWDPEKKCYITHPSRRAAANATLLNPSVEILSPRGLGATAAQKRQVIAAMPASLKLTAPGSPRNNASSNNKGQANGFTRSLTTTACPDGISSPSPFKRKNTLTGFNEASSPNGAFRRTVSSTANMTVKAQYDLDSYNYNLYSARDTGKKQKMIYNNSRTANAPSTSSRNRYAQYIQASGTNKQTQRANTDSDIQPARAQQKKRQFKKTTSTNHSLLNNSNITTNTPNRVHSSKKNKREEARGRKPQTSKQAKSTAAGHHLSNAGPNVFERLTSNYYNHDENYRQADEDETMDKEYYDMYYAPDGIPGMVVATSARGRMRGAGGQAGSGSYQSHHQQYSYNTNNNVHNHSSRAPYSPRGNYKRINTGSKLERTRSAFAF